jgi:hypothetical protein
MRNLALFMGVSVFLSGCAGVSYILENYEGVPVKNFEHRGSEFRIFDLPNQQKLMITPSIMDAAASGIVPGLTLGLVRDTTPKPIFQDATVAYLASEGRKCTVTDGYILIEPQWEFRYSCALDVPPVIPPPAKPAE